MEEPDVWPRMVGEAQERHENLRAAWLWLLTSAGCLGLSWLLARGWKWRATT